MKKIISMLLSLSLLYVFTVPGFASEQPSYDEEVDSVKGILVGDTDFVFSVTPGATTRSAGEQEIRITKYITIEEILDDGTMVMNMADTASFEKQNFTVYMTIKLIGNTGNAYRYSVMLEIAPLGSGSAVKSFSATLDYGDGSSASNFISFDSPASSLVQLTFPDKYFSPGTYTVRISHYQLLVFSGDDWDQPTTEPAGLMGMLFDVITVP